MIEVLWETTSLEKILWKWQVKILKSFTCALKFQRNKAEIILARKAISKKVK